MPIHPRTTLTTDQGTEVQAISPIIISASRSTDIPAFYGPWFIKRLEAGYVRWINPWNGRSTYVSLREVRAIVFWTKNPAPFLPLLREIDRRGIHYYFHFTLNDYEREGLEPGLPPLAERIATFKRLSRTIGRERVLWRFDPFIFTADLGPEQLLSRIRKIGVEIAAYTGRLTVSFLTEYSKVKRNFHWAGIVPIAPDSAEKDLLLDRLAGYLAGWNISGFTCAEGLSDGRRSINNGKCIDDGLMRKLWSGDLSLLRFLDANAGGRDAGQRPGCRCIPGKDIGRYDTCGHGCCYCYANASPHTAVSAVAVAPTEADAII